MGQLATKNPFTSLDWLSTITDLVKSWDEQCKDDYESIRVFSYTGDSSYPGKLFDAIDWAKVMARNNSCLVSTKSYKDTTTYYGTKDVGCGILALLRYPYQTFLCLDKKAITLVTRTGKEYATIVLADKRPCFYMPVLPSDIPTALGIASAPILVPKSTLTYLKLPAYITVTDVAQVVSIACEFPGNRDGKTPAFSGEYSYYRSFTEDGKTYIAPEVKAEQVVMLTAPYTTSINISGVVALPDKEITTMTNIGGYATTGFFGGVK